ncbi:hypothetical protein IOD16_17770 [Saccharothrix sp. 6-C]|uniref:Uncharacterized protein n=1 Tax=Saccharothrix texasensis TaxID=103734 RepID=A0A3N1GZD0_9PSEU|nr:MULTISPECIES: hypothetical protein [Saccharothrix]QQQ80064.1 hypothetical protein IOD16_17770 [Saccharothrix sp. 6-C]ROP35663.1 hypothetical protein EDD40_0902 [Saccharothrix texasensis]
MSDDHIDPMNLTAQLHYRAAGNPPSTLPESAISNAFPGLEFDIRNIWRRLLVGIELHESDNYVVAADPGHERLVGRRLLTVAGHDVIGGLVGPTRPGAGSWPLTTPTNPDGVTMLEWSNSLADVLAEHVGRSVPCLFTSGPAPNPVGKPAALPDPGFEVVELEVRPLFARSAETGDPLAVIAEEMAGPGDLTRGLCSPWQNDYRECACYYWAASRPDYVNVEDTAAGTSTGNHWFAKDREPRVYVLDGRDDSRLVSYDDLFQDWQGRLRFIVGGNDAPEHLEAEQEDR